MRILAAFTIALALPAAAVAQEPAATPTPPPAATSPAAEAAPASAPKAAPAATSDATDSGASGLGNLFLQTHTPLTNDKGTFEARVTHRFRDAARVSKWEGALGLDSGNDYGIHFDYAPFKNVSIQSTRVSTLATYEFAAKVTLLRPTASLPVALGVRGGLDWQTAVYSGNKYATGFAQALVSATIGDRFTLGAAPSWVARTPSGVRAVNVPIAGMLLVTKSISAYGEYVFPLRSKVPDTVGQWSFGVEKRVYNHRFALWIGNSSATVVNQTLAGDYDGFAPIRSRDIHLGFNLVRQFDIGN